MKCGAGAVAGDAGQGGGDRGRQLCCASAVKQAAAGRVCASVAVSMVAGVWIVSMIERPGGMAQDVGAGMQSGPSCSIPLPQHPVDALLESIVIPCFD